ncbi:hypothetical protein [Pseudomonas sp. SDO5271_S396]
MPDKIVITKYTGTVSSISPSHSGGIIGVMNISITPDDGSGGIYISEQVSSSYKSGSKISYSKVENTTRGTSFYTTKEV